MIRRASPCGVQYDHRSLIEFINSDTVRFGIVFPRVFRGEMSATEYFRRASKIQFAFQLGFAALNRIKFNPHGIYCCYIK